MKVFRTASIPLSELGKLKHRCCWKDCQNTTPVGQDLPRSWRWLITGCWPSGSFGFDKAERDGVLCGEHAARLEDLLEDIGLKLDQTVGGKN